MNLNRRTFLVSLLLIVSIRASAEELNLGVASSPVDTHMFASQGFLFSSGNNYLAKSKSGTFDFTEVGINFTKQLDDKLRTGLQITARDTGPTGNFDAQADWYYLDYHWMDELGLRAGRVKVPFGLYNEVNDIDSGRVPILLPQSVYPLANRDFLLAQTGVELYGRKDVSAGALDYRVYAGTINIDVDNRPSGITQVDKIDVPYVIGSRVMWETPVEGLRLGASVQTLRLDTTLLFTGKPPVKVEVPALMWVGSVEYTDQKLLLATEYSRWYLDVRSDNPALFPARHTTSERAYALASYRVSDYVQPGLSYSVLFPNVENRSGRAGKQHDVGATLRFDITSNWIVKAEAHYMHGTAGVNSGLNDYRPLNDLTTDWIVFLLKTTVYF